MSRRARGPSIVLRSTPARRAMRTRTRASSTIVPEAAAAKTVTRSKAFIPRHSACPSINKRGSRSTVHIWRSPARNVTGRRPRKSRRLQGAVSLRISGMRRVPRASSRRPILRRDRGRRRVRVRDLPWHQLMEQACAKFDHDRTRFELLGAHRTVGCADCHYRQDGIPGFDEVAVQMPLRDNARVATRTCTPANSIGASALTSAPSVTPTTTGDPRNLITAGTRRSLSTARTRMSPARCATPHARAWTGSRSSSTGELPGVAKTVTATPVKLTLASR